MDTQTSSKPRVKNDQFGDQGFQHLFEGHKSQTLETFRHNCIQAIMDSSGKKATKDKFVGEINKARSKDQLLFTVTNYMLAGEGKRV